MNKKELNQQIVIAKKELDTCKGFVLICQRNEGTSITHCLNENPALLAELSLVLNRLQRFYLESMIKAAGKGFAQKLRNSLKKVTEKRIAEIEREAADSNSRMGVN